MMTSYRMMINKELSVSMLPNREDNFWYICTGTTVYVIHNTIQVYTNEKNLNDMNH